MHKRNLLRDAAKFYWLWIRRALWHAPGRTDGIISLLGTILAVVTHFVPWVGDVIGAVWWQVILWTFASVTAVRLVLAPYWIWREEEAKGEGFLGQLAERTTAKERREKIGAFLSEARTYFGMAKDGDPKFDEKAVESWFDGVKDYVSAEFGDAEVQQLVNGAGHVTYSSPGEHKLTAGLQTLNIRLGELLTRIS